MGGHGGKEPDLHRRGVPGARVSQPKTRRDVDTVVIEWDKREPRVSVPVVINLPGVVVCHMVREHGMASFTARQARSIIYVV